MRTSDRDVRIEFVDSLGEMSRYLSETKVESVITTGDSSPAYIGFDDAIDIIERRSCSLYNYNTRLLASLPKT
jgi:hypothetical protein